MITEAAWTLTGSSEFVVAGESFTLTCNPQDSNAIAVKWKRLDIDTTAAGTSRASVQANGCKIGSGYDTQYQYTCEPGPVYKLTIPANVMKNSQNNKVWRCESVFGGAEAEYQVKVQVPVPSVSLEGISGQQITVTAGQSKSITCVTGASRPAPHILWYIGMTNMTSSSTETQLPSQELFYARSILTFIPTKSQNGLQINCKAYNIDNNMVELTTKRILNIQYVPGKVILSPSSLDNIVNETYQLGPIKCSATCEPPCNYKWIRPYQDVIQGDTMTISSIQRTQRGTYKCQAYNTVGTQNSSDISVIVHCK
ncbi:hypothetical protein KUTeg_002866 [Tegillarca granosa]|uniref:Ig-like domain-containing protein n=1 Tax=Tegillarca granosa TaxID=220873 RepID=A0ABQ9FQQ0_TEGGR|nr:hypothetical protein KUTeg_002866 [Tegillarca granosa]